MENNVNIIELDKFIYRWNLNNPIDRWFRKRYQIPFNSPNHRVISVYDQAMEYREDLIFNQMRDSIDKEIYIPGGDIYKPLTKKEKEDVFNNLNENIDAFLDAMDSK